MGDGSIPEAQQKILLGVGDWLKVNGEGIYGSRPWGSGTQSRPGEGPNTPTETPGDWKGGSTDRPGPTLKRKASVPPTEADFRFTTANRNLYAFGYKYPAAQATIRSLNSNAAKVERVTLLAPQPTRLKFTQTAESLVVTLPAPPSASTMPYGLRVEGTHSLGAV
jgi:alpha-L-fucosidase